MMPKAMQRGACSADGSAAPTSTSTLLCEHASPCCRQMPLKCLGMLQPWWCIVLPAAFVVLPTHSCRLACANRMPANSMSKGHL
jgi:hypothetical protein